MTDKVKFREGTVDPALKEEYKRNMLRAMVDEIGSEPTQDMHFDAWYYPGQLPHVVGLQSYGRAVIREFIRINKVEPNSAVVFMANFIIAGL